jgi:hypothetical protein
VQIRHLKEELQHLRETKKQLKAEIIEEESKLETLVPIEDYLDSNDEGEEEEEGF